MLDAARIRDILGTIHVSPDSTSALYIISAAAQELVGARNAMVAELDEDRSSLTLRAGTGAEWQPAFVGQQTRINESQGGGIISRTALLGTSFVTGNVAVEAAYRKLIETTRSELASPILDRYGKVRGVLNVESDQPDRFSQQDQQIVEMLAMMAGCVFDREDSHFREEAFWEVGTALDEAITEDQLLARVSQVTQKVLRVSAYSIFLWDPSANAFVLKDTVGSSTLSKEAKYEPGEGCTGWVCQHGLPIKLENPSSDPRWRGRYLEFPIDQIYAYICVPIFGGQRSMGCMRAIRKKATNPFYDIGFTDDDERLLMAIADQLGAGLVKIRTMNKLLMSERMAAIGELSARTSHMIGNRVFGISGDVNELKYILSEPDIDRKAALAALDGISKGIHRLEEIIQDYKDFVTATKLSPEHADLNAVVADAANSIVPRSSPVRIELHLDEKLPPFMFDAGKLGRAVSELVENSLHYMKEGKLIVGTGAADESDLSHIGLQRKTGRFAKVWVEDQGPGVDVDKKEAIFKAYESSHSKGMGLGLSIVKGIAEAHGGTIYENGKPGFGARFVILIPMRVT